MDQGHRVVRVSQVYAIANIQADGKVLIINKSHRWLGKKTSQAGASCIGVNLNLRQRTACPVSS